MADLTKQDLDKLTSSMKDIAGTDEKVNDIMDSLIKLLALPEPQFEILAPGIMQSFQQVINNPNDKIGLVQTLNATGYKADDLINAFNAVVEEIDKSNLPKIKRDFLKEMLGSVCNTVNDTEGIANRIKNRHPSNDIQYNTCNRINQIDFEGFFDCCLDGWSEAVFTSFGLI